MKTDLVKKIAIVGIQGVPAKYGGFETLVENLLDENCSDEIQYTVFCSSKSYTNRLDSYKGAFLKYMCVRANGKLSVLYDILSLIRVIRGYDVTLLLGVSGCIFLPIFRFFSKSKIIVNIDGIEYKRSKWNCLAKKFLQFSEYMAVKNSNIIIADNEGIQNYVFEHYKKKTRLIAYGGDQVILTVPDDENRKILQQCDIESNTYAISICRIEPENNCHIILESFACNGQILVFVGNWNRSDYSRNLKKKYAIYKNIHLLNSIYDLKVLYVLRQNCKFYIHGHSAGGTNPSLVEAMFFGMPIFAFDVIYNKLTTEYQAHYFNTVGDLSELMNMDNYELSQNAMAMKEIANRRYKWEDIIKLYEDLFREQ